MESNIFKYFHEDLGLIISFIPVFISFWGAFTILINKQKTKAQVYLAFSFIIIGLGALFSFWYERYETVNRNEIIRSVNLIFTVLVTISALLYFIVLMQPSKLNKKFFLALSLFASGFVATILIADSFAGQMTHITGYKELYENLNSSTVIFRLVLSVILIIFEIYAFTTVWKMYRQHKKIIKEYYSYQEDINLNWILYSMILYALLGLTDLLWILDSSLTTKCLSTIMMIIILVHIYWLGMRQHSVPLIEEPKNDLEIKKKFTELNISKEKLKQDLYNYFKNEKPYLNPQLSLIDVAKALNTNRTYLSQLINEDLEMNFYSFVNQYRINYAISLIKEQHHIHTIESLCEMAGFKSKSVFYRQFKEITGLSPSEYIKNYSNNQQQ